MTLSGKGRIVFLNSAMRRNYRHGNLLSPSCTIYHTSSDTMWTLSEAISACRCHGSPPEAKLVVNKSGLSSNLSFIIVNNCQFIRLPCINQMVRAGHGCCPTGHGCCPTGQLPGRLYLPDIKFSCPGQSVNR